MKNGKRVLTVLLVALFLMCLSVTAFSDGENNGYCGKNGDNLSWSVENGALTISGEGKMEDYDVTSGVYPPWNTQDFSSVIINSGVASIGNYAFCNNNIITSITIPSTVKTIGRSCFENCTGLTEVSIVEGVESIDNYAFMGCTGILEINVPDSVNTLGIEAFSGCTSLMNFTFPDSIKSIPQGVLQNCGELKSINIPDSAEIIDASAFNGCKKLISVTIPENVTSVGSQAFRFCESLETVYWNAIDANCNKRSPFYNAGKNAGELSIVFGNNVKKIPEGICYIKATGNPLTGDDNQDFIKNVTIGNSVEEIGAEAFRECRLLKSITIPDSVKIIRESAFYETYLNEIVFGNGLETIEDLAFKNLKVQEIVLPESVKNVASGAFGGTVEKITIGSKLNNISFLSGMNHLKEVKINPANSSFVSVDGVVFNKGKTAVCFYPPLRESAEYTIPSGVTLICEGCFNSNKKLEKVIASKGLKKIEGNTFMACSSLKEIVLPVSLTEIGKDAFKFTSVNDVYYEGSEADRNKITFSNDTIPPSNATWHYNIKLEGDEPAPLEPAEANIIKGNSADKNKTYDYKTTVIFTAVLPEGASAEWYVNNSPAGNGSTLKVENKTSDYTVKVIVTAKDGSKTVDTENVHIKNGFFDKIVWFFKHLFNPDAFIVNQ